MNKFRNALIISIVAIALTGCARTAPVFTPNTNISINVSADKVKNSILEAGMKRDWVMTAVSPGIIDGKLTSRDHSVNIRITYNSKLYTINYVSSQEMLAEKGKIHRNYNRWVNNLDKDIQQNLMTKNN